MSVNFRETDRNNSCDCTEGAGNSSGRDFLIQFLYLKFKERQCDLSKIIQS